MRVSLIFLLIVLAICSAVDRYIYRQIQLRVHDPRPWLRLQLWSAIAFQALLVIGMLIPARAGDNAMLLTKMWLFFGYATIYLPKILFVILDSIALVPTLFHKKRLKPLTILGIGMAVLLFGGMWWGALINRFRIDNKQVDIREAGLPESFDGYRIVQISDLHLGTLVNNTTFLAKIIADVNAQKPDLVVFTGDIVNRQSVEIEPFVTTLATLDAPDGVLAILGNHDYGDYMNWQSPEEKTANMEQLYAAYGRTNIRLLRNETVWIRRGNDSIAIIGVENIGDPPFPVYGSLAKAYPAANDSRFKILLSHNPAHWVDSIANHPDVNIPLTLSGHTHAMQIELLGLSPAAWRYPTWGGLYSDAGGAIGSETGSCTESETGSSNESETGSSHVGSSFMTHQLYVNIGAGTVGLPMRLGATPEVTILTLSRPNS